MRRVRAERGVTLIEVTMILTATLAIMGALAPTLSSVVRNAERTSATTEMNKIAAAIQAFQLEVRTNFTIDGSNGTVVQLLVSDGDIPGVSATGSASWQAVVDNTTGLTDFLERHLVFNQPRGSALNAYSTTSANPWRGAYLTAPIDPDPWGNRYGVNVQFLGPAPKQDVVVFSAGPDEEIDTLFAVDGLVVGDDDIIVLVEA